MRRCTTPRKMAATACCRFESLQAQGILNKHEQVTHNDVELFIALRTRRTLCKKKSCQR